MTSAPPKSRLEDQLVSALQDASPELIAAYLFGSRARGDSGHKSDLDVAVLTRGPQPAGLLNTLTRLSGALEREIGVPVDLVDLRRAPVDLIHRVLRDGELVLDREPRFRIEFEVRARNEYFDLLPHLVRYRSYRAA